VHARLAQYHIGDHPAGDEQQNEPEKNRLPGKETYAFDDALRAADLLFYARVEVEDCLDILADLIALEVERLMGVVRRPRRPRRRGGRGFNAAW
jgi:hypothetical protein